MNDYNMALVSMVVMWLTEGDEDAGGALRMSLMGWNKETIFTDYAVLGG